MPNVINAPKTCFFDRIPSRAILDAHFASHWDTEKAWAVLTGEANPCESSDATRRWANSCFHHPQPRALVLHALDDLLGTHGVQAAVPDADDGWLSKVQCLNSGDLYSPTLLIHQGDVVLATVEDLRVHHERGGTWESFVKKVTNEQD